MTARNRLQVEELLEVARLAGSCLAVKNGVHQADLFDVSHISGDR
jgi:hypothetical protein